jgi:hypothetical protein
VGVSWVALDEALAGHSVMSFTLRASAPDVEATVSLVQVECTDAVGDRLGGEALVLIVPEGLP